MNLGHGRAGHLPDIAFIKYKYMPAWGKWNEIIKDNPSDYLCAFKQMVYALKYLRNEYENFELNTYDPINEYEDKIKRIFALRQLSCEKEWKQFGEELSGEILEDFSSEQYQNEYLSAENKENTLFNNFIIHALKQKSMVVNRIYKSKNKLAGYSVEYSGNILKGLKDYWKLVEHEIKEVVHEQDK